MQNFLISNNFSFLECGYAVIKNNVVWRNKLTDTIGDENLLDRKWDSLVPVFAYHRLYLITDGCATLKLINSSVLKLEKGKMYLIPPFQIVSIEKSEYISHFYFHFKSNTSNIDPFEFFNLVNPVEIDNGCIDLCRSLLALFEKNDMQSKLAAQGYFSLLISKFFTCETSIQPAFNQFLPVLGYIDAHLSEKITVKQLAGILGYTESYFSVLFSKQFNTPPLQYVTEKKMLRACQQLTLSDLSIREISEGLGFENEFYFNTVFKKHFGNPPGVWKKQYFDQFK